MNMLRGQIGQVATRLIVLVVMLYLVVVPLVILILASLRDPGRGLPFGRTSFWSAVNYKEVFANARTWELVANTIVLSLGSLMLAFVISIIAAWLVERTNLPAQGFAFVMIIAGIGTPGFISAIAWTLLLNPSNGVLNVWIRNIFGLSGDGPFNISTLPGMILVEGLGLVPVTFLLLTAAFRALDVSLEDAAGASGAPPRVVARKVTLPLLTPPYSRRSSTSSPPRSNPSTCQSQSGFATTSWCCRPRSICRCSPRRGCRNTALPAPTASCSLSSSCFHSFTTSGSSAAPSGTRRCRATPTAAAASN
ncbi:ABC transporter permease [Mycolicibacterium agri]|uniref:ABC transporter permease n=1 Tax=Mycolicibacterium agri TaxID=36811 RepID=UPI001F235015|nr:hypothetical protein [Mycolicibacterium agri]